MVEFKVNSPNSSFSDVSKFTNIHPCQVLVSGSEFNMGLSTVQEPYQIQISARREGDGIIMGVRHCLAPSHASPVCV